MIDRRQFLQLAAIAGCLRTHGALGQATDQVKRVGVLHEGAIPGAMPQPMLAAFAERGWVVNGNLVFERVRASTTDQLPERAKDLVKLKVDLILVTSTPAAKAAKAATATIPIVFNVGDDPVANGLVTSMARPGGNLTGFAWGLFDEKLLQLLKEALPKASRVMYPTQPSFAASAVAEKLRVKTIVFAVPDAQAFDAFFEAVRKERPDGVVMPNIGWMGSSAKRIGEGLLDCRVPCATIWKECTEAGGMLSYGPQPDFMRLIAKIDALLRGAKPGDTPVEMPTRFNLVINLKTAKALGVIIPQSLLHQASDTIPV